MKVSYRARALEDVDEIYQWRARQNTDVAEKVEAAVFAAADWLGEHPEFGTRTSESKSWRRMRRGGHLKSLRLPTI